MRCRPALQTTIRHPPSPSAVGREAVVTAVGAQEVAEQGGAHLSQRPVVEVVAAAGPRCLHVGSQPSGRARQRAERRSEEPCLDSPPHDVPVAEPTGRPRSPSADQEEVPAGRMKLLRDLAASDRVRQQLSRSRPLAANRRGCSAGLNRPGSSRQVNARSVSAPRRKSLAAGGKGHGGPPRALPPRRSAREASVRRTP